MQGQKEKIEWRGKNCFDCRLRVSDWRGWKEEYKQREEWNRLNINKKLFQKDYFVVDRFSDGEIKAGDEMETKVSMEKRMGKGEIFFGIFEKVRVRI